MRRTVKRQLLQYLREMEKVQKSLQVDLPEPALLQALEQLQSAGYETGTAIEESEGEGTRTVDLLEKYCEMLYQCAEKAEKSGWESRKTSLEMLDRALSSVRESLKQEIPMQTEALLLTSGNYGQDEFEDFWKKVTQRKGWHTSIVTKAEQSAVIWNTLRPDFVFVQDVSDNENLKFSSRDLKQYTDFLVYVPTKVDRKNICTPASFNADYVLVGTKDQRDTGVRTLTDLTGEETQTYWKEKILTEESFMTSFLSENQI